MNSMNKMTRDIQGYTPLSEGDLRLFPQKFSWFIANIILMLLGIGFGSTLLAINYFGVPPDVYIVYVCGCSVAVSVLCILIIRGHVFAVQWLRLVSMVMLAMALTSGVLMFGERGNIAAWIGGMASIVSLLILTNPSYFQIAQFYKRMMDRQRLTGLTRAEDIMIHLMIAEGSKEGFENARQIVINAQERLKKSPH